MKSLKLLPKYILMHWVIIDDKNVLLIPIEILGNPNYSYIRILKNLPTM